MMNSIDEIKSTLEGMNRPEDTEWVSDLEDGLKGNTHTE